MSLRSVRKRSTLIAVIGFMVIYVVLAFIYHQRSEYFDAIQVQILLVFLGLGLLVFFNMKYPSGFLDVFTAGSLVFYLIDSVYPMMSSLITGKNPGSIDLSFMANTEGFILLFLAVLWVFRRKEKE
jgi:hypothetical protein